VDGSLVSFDAETTYRPLDNEIPQSDAADPGDLAPAGIASQGAALRVQHMRVLRDIYYIADREDGNLSGGGIWDYRPRPPFLVTDPDDVARFMSDPREWRPRTPGEKGPFQLRQEVTFPLEENQFFAMGDNSPYSKDSRLWFPEHYVDRKLLIGKALFIYWPHSWDQVPGTPIPLPFFPNFQRMHLVR
jgi:hypothetical protein